MSSEETLLTWSELIQSRRAEPSPKRSACEVVPKSTTWNGSQVPVTIDWCLTHDVEENAGHAFDIGRLKSLD